MPKGTSAPKSTYPQRREGLLVPDPSAPDYSGTYSPSAEYLVEQQPAAPRAQVAVEPESMSQQTFHWTYRSYDITRLLDDLHAGRLQPERCQLPAEIVGRYAQEYVIKGTAGPIRFDMEHALYHAPDRLHEPVILLHVGEGEGLLTMTDDPAQANWVVGDGNHRMVAAGLQQVGLPAFVLTREQSANYEVPDDDVGL